LPKPTPVFDSSEHELHSQLPERRTACPPLDVLLALEQDALPAELAEPARAHLAVCSLCTMLLADMASLPQPEFSRGQQERIAVSLPIQKASTSSWSSGKALIALAAALLLAFGLVFWNHGQKNREVAQVQPLTLSPVLQQKEIPFAPLAAPSGSAALLTRGSGTDTEPANEQLLPAFRAYNHGEYAAAAELFGTLSTEYPRSGMTALYLGVSQLALHQDERASTTLHHARETNKPYDADAVQWYSAVAASRVHPEEERPLLTELCQKKASAYSARSCEALR
jgi:hypothetical protein